MSLPYILTAQVARPKRKNVWRIEHAATHLSITILLPDTDPPGVKWVLPSGQQIDGNALDADVPAGETLCICDDFSRCGIDMTGCDPYALCVNVGEMPVTRPRLVSMRGRRGMYRDVVFNSPATVLTPDGEAFRGMGAGKYKIVGSADCPVQMVMTVEDINRRKAASGSGRATHTHLEIGYAPFFTGDLANLNIDTQHFYREPNADFTSYVQFNASSGHMRFVMQHTIIHHTGVHGHCDLSSVSPGHFGFYGNPNMTPDDYDQTVIAYAANMQTLSDASALTTLTIDPEDSILEISKRRTSASDAAVEQLRTLGCTVVEIEDE